ncbi:preprotein translocase subunit SecY, partial [Enterococcus faecalis]
MRSKILFTVLILSVYRLGAHITVPGVNAKGLSVLSSLPFLNMLNMVSGSPMQKFAIFSMGVSPYITASIIIHLLQMDIVPRCV